MVAYNASILVWHGVVGIQKPPLPEEAPSFGKLLGEVAFGILLYDVVIWPLHWSFHHLPSKYFSWWRHLHLSHHNHYRSPSDSLMAGLVFRQHYLDAAVQVMVNILVQQVTPFGGWREKHFLSRLVHNVVVTYLLIEVHCGYDFPFHMHRLYPAIFGGAPRHERHHQTGHNYFHQFFRFFDDAFGYVETSPAKAMKAL
mmetsp:Transcript_32951/g.71953  ORF Transcript_32951/g.71953 Transcript_32951/m.71953 type:complete len:198 (-) Transcript_32951:101-694(-)